MGNRKLSGFTTEEMLALENLALEQFGVSTDQMMWWAGKSLHDFVVGELPEVRRILVMSGKGNNGGDALVAGQMFSESGYEVAAFRVDSSFPEDFDFNRFDLIIDGLFGFSLKGNPRPPMDRIIEQINCSGAPVLSVDVPSGLEVYTGEIMKPTIRATYTLTLGMPKRGLAENPEYAGKV
ncbi:MAG: NAD(P)H-hydrate epimerase, partial [Patescibacteria group bacterium]